jgi:hypothetical protein
MKTKKVVQAAHQLSKPYRITNGKKFRLKDFDPADTGDLKSADKPRAKEALQTGVEALAELQDVLYAQDRWSLLLIFQAMERGRIGIFNRSYYEETLVVRVHPEFLAAQKLPKECVTKNIWEERFQDIRAFERYLHRNGTVVVKFFLHVSREEQQKRFLERLDNPDKNWKFSLNDAKERGFWDDYMDAYEQTIRETATEDSPWYVVPADNKWFTRVIVASAVIDALASLKLQYPKVSAAKRRELGAARKALLATK